MFSYTSPGPVAAELARLANESLVGLARAHPNAFSALIALPMRDVERAVAEVEHWWGFVHGGGVAPYLIGRWDHGWTQRAVTRELIPDHRPSELLRAFWFDHIVHDRRALLFLAEVVGWDRIMVGSDCPFDMGYVDPVDFLDRAGIDERHRAGVLSDNATAFLRSP